MKLHAMSQAVLNYLLLDTKKEAGHASSYMKVSLFLFEEKRIWLPTTDQTLLLPPFQIIRRFNFSAYNALTMYLDIVYI